MQKLLSLAFILPVSFLFSQGISTSEKTESFSTGSHNSIVVNIPYGKKDIIEDELKDELKDLGGKYNSSKDEYTSIQASTKDMGDKKFDVYSKIISGNDGQMSVAFAIDLGGAYLSSREHKAQFDAMNSRIKKFAKNVAEECVDFEMDTEAKILKTMEKEQKDLEKENEDQHKAIEDYKKKIQESEDKIKENEKMQGEKKGLIEKQNTIISDIDKKKKGIK